MHNLAIKKDLSMDELLIVSTELEKNKKSKALSYVLLIFLGWLGVHRFYLGQISLGILNLLVGIFGIIISFFIFLNPYLILFIIELIILSGAVNKINNARELEIINNVRMMRRK